MCHFSIQWQTKNNNIQHECLLFCSNCWPISSRTNPVLFFLLLTSSHTRSAAVFYCRSVCDRIYNFNSLPNTHRQTHCVWLAHNFRCVRFFVFCRIRFVCLIFFVSVERKLVYHLKQRYNMFSFCRCLLAMVSFFYLFIYLLLFARFDTISLLLTS